jgi:pantothenate synthetase
LRQAVDLIGEGEPAAAVIRERALALFAPWPEARVEYFELTDPQTLEPLDRIDLAGPVLVAAAMWLGSTRLIDNMSWPGKRRT